MDETPKGKGLMLEEAPLQSNFDQAVREYYVPSTNDGDGIRPVVQMVKNVNSAPWGAGVPTWVRDATANDSDKTFTVPEKKVWGLISIEASLKASATVGNRTLEARLFNSAGESIRMFNASPAIAATVLGALRVAGNAIAPSGCKSIQDSTANSTVNAYDVLPQGVLLPAGYYVRVWDYAAIDAAADDMTVVLHYIEYDA